ncbi:MAG: DUF721 domain-containing protein [Deltaproteobacteria bacterium]|nr:DUF721 domain-containing protein [Deltaproteobacteria bacterium]
MKRQRNSSSKASKTTPDTLSGVLTRSFEGIGIDHMLREYRVKKLWEDAVGKNMARHARADKLKKQSLYITAENTAWANEFVYLKKTVMEKINSLAKEDLVKEIIVKTTGKKDDKLIPAKKPLKTFKKREVTPEEIAEINRLTEDVKDPVIRNAMRRAMTESKRRNTED